MTTCANWRCPDNESGKCYVGGCDERKPLDTWEPERCLRDDLDDDENENENERNDELGN